jgi:exonuclease III
MKLVVHSRPSSLALSVGPQGETHIRIACWNIRRSTKISLLWDYFREMDIDIALLQEIKSIPQDLYSTYQVYTKYPINKRGNLQPFNTGIMVRGNIISEYKFTHETIWINSEIDKYSGNLISCKVTINNKEFNLISVYSPAWPIIIGDIDKSYINEIKLQNNNDLFLTEIIWAILRDIPQMNRENWIIGGDFNSSETFDYLWGRGPRGNREILDRMNALGFIECLREKNGKLIPTFQNPSNKKIIHQMDHLFMHKSLYENVCKCYVGDPNNVFNSRLSDHLPIIAEIA